MLQTQQVSQQRISANNQNPSCPEPASSSVVEENTTYTSTLFNNEMSNRQKILGVSWDPDSDMLEFDIRSIAKSLQALEPTKRNIVTVASRFYDPLDYLSPVIITLKVFFQELCKSKLNWDEPLPSVLFCKWKSLVSKFQGIVISVPDTLFIWQIPQRIVYCMDSAMLLHQLMLLFTCTMDQIQYSL